MHTKKLLSVLELKLEQVQQAYEALQIEYKKHLSDASESQSLSQSLSGGERERLSAEWNKLESEKSKVDSDKRELETQKLELESQKRELERVLVSSHNQIEHVSK